MKRTVRALLFLLFAALSAVALTACSKEHYMEDFRYTSNGDGTCYVEDIGFCTDEKIVIPAYTKKGERVTGIGNHAFKESKNITEITIPASVASIGRLAFANCDNLVRFVVDEANESYCTIDGNLYTKDAKTLVQYAIGKPETSFTVPKGVETVGRYAFRGCQNLESVELPKTVIFIGARAFYFCKNLKSVTMPKGLLTIEEHAFAYCESLESMVIPSAVTRVGAYAFRGCESLRKINCEAAQKPIMWHEKWNADKAVVWDYEKP